ncbi:MAG: chorismate pyruvate-lyase family protein [Actinomycetota bacterium]|nr:chorismate pyruvate-lyase family protein [Actinomycetota bacterium]MDQ6947679.1 chorismate pyruvate-lyase family protein [Actinomycetota bacterium]
MDATQSLLDVFSSLQNGTALSIFQRILLITDGTVTDVVEAYGGEAIQVVKLAQSFGQADPLKPPLDLFDAERVLRRTVLLQGTISGTNYIHADSVIAPDRLPSEVLDGLLMTGRPLGRLLAQQRIETFRDIVGVGFEPAGDCASFFGVDPTSNLVFRTYRIHLNGQPVVRITEKFPTTWFTSPLEL